MYLVLKQITLFKQTGTSGVVSITYSDKKHQDDEIKLNVITFDMNDTIEPISCYKVNNTPIISGSIFILLKRLILSRFKVYLNDKEAIGIFRFDVAKNEIVKV
jgi:hypothetical protein